MEERKRRTSEENSSFFSFSFFLFEPECNRNNLDTL